MTDDFAFARRFNMRAAVSYLDHGCRILGANAPAADASREVGAAYWQAVDAVHDAIAAIRRYADALPEPDHN